MHSNLTPSGVQGGASSYTDLLSEMPEVPPAFDVNAHSNGNSNSGFGGSQPGANQFGGNQYGAQQGAGSQQAGEGLRTLLQLAALQTAVSMAAGCHASSACCLRRLSGTGCHLKAREASA